MTNKFPLSRNSKERKVIELCEKGMNIRNIAKRVHLSFGDIGQITRKHSGDEQSIEKSKKFSKHSQTLELFHNGESNLGVAIKLGLTDLETIEELNQYRRLIGNDRFCQFYDTMKGDLESYLLLHDELSKANLTANDVIEGLGYAKHLNFMKWEHSWQMVELQRLRQQKLCACTELEALNQKKISVIGELEALNETKEAVLNEINLSIQPKQEVSSTVRIRRRRIRSTQSFDVFQTQGLAS
jgi:hypothetical protein